MSWVSKVAWTEGLFLRQQHLQQHDRYIESLVETRSRAFMPYPWGFEALKIDRAQLLQGRVGLIAAAGAFSDGFVFDAPSRTALPDAAAVPAGADRQTVWLTLPDRVDGQRELGEGEGTPARYAERLATVIDSASAAVQEAEIAIAVPRLALEVREGPRRGFQCLPVARILEVRDGVVTLDDTFTPPTLTVAAHPMQAGWIDRVIGLVEVRLADLARFAADPSAAGLQQADYLQLLLLNRTIPVLRHLKQTWRVPPERLYTVLIALAGELASFDQAGRLAATYPPYDHANLKATFDPVLRDIETLLSRDLARPIRLPLQELAPNAFLAAVPDPQLFRTATFVIEVESKELPATVQQEFPQLCKIGPKAMMRKIVNANLPGIRVIYTATPPPQIRAVSRNVYFLLDRMSPDWAEFSASPEIGLHFAGTWSDLRLVLWAIQEARR